MSRRDELAAGLASVEDRIAAACTAAGRQRTELTLIVVTKTWPATDVGLLAQLGVRDVGEARDQEAAPKAADCTDLGLRWHFLGQLQTNKVRSVAGYADWIHSVDRPRLVTALDEAATRAGRSPRCLIQVNLDERAVSAAAGRGGAPPADVPALADAVAAAPGLLLAGLMAVAPLGADAAPAFDRLAALAASVRSAHPSATVISAGMSADLEAAVAAGATHLRVGTAVLGSRPPNG